MTRLIDADLLEKEIYKWMPKDQETWTSSDIPPIENLVVSIMMTIQEQPVVDALPYDYILNIKEELRQKARESESQERKEFYLQNAEAIQRLLVTWEVKGRGTVRGYDQID